MANFTITAGSFPSGATVGAYPASLWQSAPSGPPSGAATATATAAADGSVAFTGLTSGVGYYAYSLVGSEHRYIRFTVQAAAATYLVQADLDAEAAARAAADTSVGSPNTQTANYTLVLGDAGKCVDVNHATNAITVTVPPNSSVAFPVGTVIEICRYGAGTCTIAPGAGVTLPNRVQVAGTANRTIASQLSTASLRKRATDEWVLVGDIA